MRSVLKAMSTFVFTRLLALVIVRLHGFNGKEPIIYQVRAVGPPLFKVWLPVLRSNERLELPCCQ